MSFGYSAGDIVTLAKLCYGLYNFCRTAPYEVQGLCGKLDKLKKKLDRLSAIVEKSGLGTWRRAPALEQSLLEIKEYLEPLQSATAKESSTPTRARGLVLLAKNRKELKRIEERLGEGEREIDEAKIDLILYVETRPK